MQPFKGQATRCNRWIRFPEILHYYTVNYESENHFSVLFSCWGSAWPRVLPYCIINVCLALVLQYYKDYRGLELAITDRGHKFLTMVVAFLTVSRANVSMGRFNKVLGALQTMACRTREITQSLAVMSSDCMNQAGREWRHEAAYLNLLLLRSVMCVIDHDTTGELGWELPEMDEKMRATLMKQLLLFDNRKFNMMKNTVSEREENMRVPIRLALKLRQVLLSHRTRLDKPFSAFEEIKLLTSVDNFMNGFYGVRLFLTTPFPFPLAQMARTFLFFYVFTIPFALLSDASKPFAHCVIVFFLTYGFMGLEYVSIELDDPFGADSNDFDNNRLAAVTFEDTYTTILDMDGLAWADKLRRKMDNGEKQFGVSSHSMHYLHEGVEV